MGEMMLNRRAAAKALLDNRGDLLVVTGLGSPTYDVAAAGDEDRNFYLWGAMGGACMVGLGVALARPDRRVLVITGDGEMLMGLGSLATIAVRAPANLAIAVLDNGRYGETGMQQSHTDTVTKLASVAAACGIARTFDVQDAAALRTLAQAIHQLDGPLFARVRIGPEDEPRALPTRDGVALKLRFRRAQGIPD
jgi:thiamine pyrophosphate-dependent acetolactate synthase large subunit-like protein